jgi:hypothetical protein
MATVNSEQSAENMEYVRRLLKQKQPGFSAALDLAAHLVGRELESPTCCATSALVSLDPSAKSHRDDDPGCRRARPVSGTAPGASRARTLRSQC